MFGGAPPAHHTDPGRFATRERERDRERVCVCVREREGGPARHGEVWVSSVGKISHADRGSARLVVLERWLGVLL